MIKIFLLVIVIFVSLFFARVPLATWAIKKYSASKNQDLSFEITELTLHQLKIKNIQLNKINLIPKTEIEYNLWDKNVLRKVQIEIDTLNIESLQKTIAQISSSEKTTGEPLIFADAQKYCTQLQKMELLVRWREVVIGNKTIPFDLSASNIEHNTKIEWDDQKNSKGQIFLKCKKDVIYLSSPSIRFELKKTLYNETNITDFSTQLHKAEIHWTNSKPLEWLADGKINLHYSQDKQTHIWNIPRINLQGLYQFDGSINGEFSVPDLSWGKQTAGDQFSGLAVSGVFAKNTDVTKATLRLRDKTKELFVDDLEVLQNADGLEIKANPHKTKFKFNNQHASLFPATKDLVKTLSGELNLGGHLQYKNEKWLGLLKLVGTNISSESEYGNYEGVSFSHQINSLETFSTPQGQSLKIKRINMGPGVENLDVTYAMPNLETISVQKFSAGIGKGDLFAENFTIHPQKKRIENFLAQIINVDLETLLAFALKDTVKAQGQLHGHLGITYQGQRPLFKGLLTDPKNGWIQYRATLQQQAANLSISDGPMDILNNYLYNYHYQNLSLTISSDTNYDMDMTLAALGHNPDYLGGKPLKLKVNLQQNLLAALQSIMLTYDLPNRIREKFEKVTE